MHSERITVSGSYLSVLPACLLVCVLPSCLCLSVLLACLRVLSLCLSVLPACLSVSQVTPQGSRQLSMTDRPTKPHVKVQTHIRHICPLLSQRHTERLLLQIPLLSPPSCCFCFCPQPPCTQMKVSSPLITPLFQHLFLVSSSSINAFCSKASISANGHGSPPSASQ